MKIVYGVAPVVLDVPAERGKTHAHVQPGYLHATDVGCNVSQHRGIEDRHIVQVPAAGQVMLRVRHRSKYSTHSDIAQKTFNMRLQTSVTLIFTVACQKSNTTFGDNSAVKVTML